MRKEFFKKLRTLMSVLMVGLVTTCILINAKAAEEPVTNSIEVVDFVKGSTYAGYRIFDATVNGNKVAYTIKSSSDWYGQVVESDLFTLESINDTDTEFSVALKDSDDTEAVITWIQGLDKTKVATFTVDLAKKETSATTTEVKWTDVPNGYYYITTTTGSVVSVTNASPNSTIIDKNREPNWDPEDPEHPDNPGTGKVVKDDAKSTAEKDVYAKENSVNIDSTINYKVNVYAPKYDGNQKIYSYEFVDSFPTGMEYLDDFSMTVNGTLVTSGYTALFDGGKLTITYVIDEIASYPADAHVVFKYKAKLNDTAVKKNTNNISMQWYVPNPETPDDPEEDPQDPYVPGNKDPENPEEPKVPDSHTDTYTFGFTLLKYDGIDTTKAPLPGAQFVLKKGTETISFKKDGDKYTVAKSGTDTTTTIDAGSVTIFGLAEGSDYTLTEVTAPDGYTKLKDAIPVILNELNTDDDGYLKDTVEVENLSGTTLPSTGGIGTTVFYVVGGLLVVVAGVLLITKKRMKDVE